MSVERLKSYIGWLENGHTVDVDECLSYLHDALSLEHAYDNLEAELQRYRQAEKEGRLVVLPCKKGDAVWTFGDNNTIIEAIVDYLFTGENGWILALITKYGQSFKQSEKRIGKTVFLTREAAEAALAAKEQ